jgi:hypothetical protein
MEKLQVYEESDSEMSEESSLSLAKPEETP